MSTPLNVCGNCHHWDADVDRTVGICRRLPPDHAGEWPEIDSIDWCGEHKAVQPESTGLRLLPHYDDGSIANVFDRVNYMRPGKQRIYEGIVVAVMGGGQVVVFFENEEAFTEDGIELPAEELTLVARRNWSKE